MENAVGTELNLAVCEEALGHLLAARDLYRSTVARANDGRSDMAQEKLAALNQRLPRLTIRPAPDAPASTRVTIDGTAIRFGLTEPMDPGERVLVITAIGHEDRETKVQLEEGKHKEVFAAPGKKLPEAVNAKESDADAVSEDPLAWRLGRDQNVDGPDAGSWRPLGITVGAIGIAGLAAGVVTTVMWTDRLDEVKRQCDPAPCIDAPDRDIAESGNSLYMASIVSLAVGAAGVGLGAYLTFWADEDDKGEHAKVAVIPAPGGGFMSVSGAF